MQFLPNLPVNPQFDTRAYIVAVKCATWLAVLTWGNPDILDAIVRLIERLAP